MIFLKLTESIIVAARRSGKKSATPVALEKKDEPAEKKEKLEETKVDIEEKPKMLKGQEIIKIEAGSKKIENAFNEAGEKVWSDLKKIDFGFKKLQI